MIAYIHGFNSSAASRTLGLLRQVFPRVAGLEYPSGGRFSDNLASLAAQARARLADDGPCLLVGSSLGGFYASQAAAILGCPCALFNPVVRPAEALRQFLGRNTHFHTGAQWEFTPAMLESYAAFPDTRTVNIPRFLVLGRQDEVLDPQCARDYWQGHARIHETDDAHSLARLDAPTVEALRGLVDDAVHGTTVTADHDAHAHGTTAHADTSPLPGL